MANSNRVVDAGQLDDALSAIVSEYAADLRNQLKRDVNASARIALREVKAGAARHVERGKYAKSWGIRTEPSRYGGYVKTVRSTIPGLPHLLDKGHMMRNGQYLPGDGHVAKAGERAVADFERRLNG